MTWTGRDGRPPAHARARNVSSAPPSTRPRKRRNRQRLQHRKASVAGTYLEHGERVVHHKDWIHRLRSHLRAKHRRQLQILAVCTKSTPPVQQSVRAGEMGRVLEQGGCARSGGQQLMLHGEPGAPSNQSDTGAALRSGPVQLCAAAQHPAARNSQTGQIRAAAAVDHEVHALGAHSTRKNSASKLDLAAGNRGQHAVG